MDNIPKKILIVEDDAALSKALNLKLTHEGFATKVASDGEIALDILRQENFDLILLDLIMPKIDGFGVLEALRRSKNMTKVIVISGLSQPEDVKRVKDLGAYGYFTKSEISLPKIVESIKANLQNI